MEINRILSSSLLDLVFDNRNKDYGAYDLRATYPQRIKRALFITITLMLLFFIGMFLGNSAKSSVSNKLALNEISLTKVPDEKEPEPPKTIPKPQPQPQIRTEQLANVKIVQDKDVVTPPPDQDDLLHAKIDVFKQDGVDPGDAVDLRPVDDGKGIIEDKKNDGPTEPFTKVEVPAKYDGDWSRFLLKNLRSEVPVDNGAAVGKYKVMIRFVVDVDGTVSDIVPVSSNGYGMENEAVRVLKKADKWKPAIQNGMHVKAYHTQVIVFDVQGNE